MPETRWWPPDESAALALLSQDSSGINVDYANVNQDQEINIADVTPLSTIC